MPIGMRERKLRETWGGAEDMAAARFSRPFEWAAGLLWMILLWSWITPVAELSQWTGPEKTVPLYAATGVFVLLDMLRVPAALGVSLKAAAAWLAVGWLFREAGGHSGIGFDWLRVYGSVTAADFRSAASGAWDSISGENRTMIFLGGWGLLAGVVQTLLVHQRRGLWLVVATWTYLIVLQLWPGLDTTRELLASGASGLALLSVLHLDRIRVRYAAGLLRRMPREEQAGEESEEGRGSIAAAPLVPVPAEPVWVAAGTGRTAQGLPPFLYAGALALSFMLFAGALAGAGSSGAGAAAQPISPEVWNRLAEALHLPVEFPAGGERAAAAVSVPVHAVAGYGDDDSRLGGPLQVVDEPLFTARTPMMTYWRGESKNVYDGKGWKEAAEGEGGADRLAADGSRETWPASSDPAASAEARMMAADNSAVPAPAILEQELLYTGRRLPNLLFAGGKVEQVVALYTADGQSLPEDSLSLDPASGRYSLPESQGLLAYAKLRVLPAEAPDPQRLLQAAGEVSGHLARQYLQLPAALPERVKRLAADTAAGGATPYAKAQLIEAFLKTNYRYSLTEAPVPEAGEDFVDRFLFGPERSGYCDYFSTAMTVMLRSAGVPARWVKGFAPGEAVASEGGVLTVAVGSKDAHSWVEAYIPGAGWVPFDPTPGFQGFAADGSNALTAAPSGGITASAANGPSTVARSDLPADAPGNAPFGRLQASLAAALERAAQAAGAWLNGHRWPAAAAVLALLPVLLLLRSGGQLLALQLLLRFRRRGKAGPTLAVKLLDRMWLRVFRRYGPLSPGQTLREYASEAGVREPKAREAFFELVRLDEQIRYAGGQPPWIPRGRMTALWRELFGSSSGRGGGGIQL